MNVTFLVMVDVRDAIDPLTGITRHDLIGSIIRDRFNWSNIFGAHCNIVSDKESFTDSNYIIRTIVLEQEPQIISPVFEMESDRLLINSHGQVRV